MDQYQYHHTSNTTTEEFNTNSNVKMSNTAQENIQGGTIRTQHEPIHTPHEDSNITSSHAENQAEGSHHHRRGSHGSHGNNHENEHGIKKVLHQISDKIHPYNTQVEVSCQCSEIDWGRSMEKSLRLCTHGSIARVPSS